MTRAAEYIESSQSAVSLQVRLLEEELGATLFERHGPSISLTRSGEMLYTRVMPLVAGMDRLPGAFAERHHGVAADVLRIGAGETSAAYLLPKYLQRFRERWPDVGIEVRTGTGRDRLRWLRSYELDLVVGGMDVSPPDVEFHSVLASEFALITPADHALAGRGSVTIEEATAYHFVEHSATRHTAQVAQAMFRLRGVAPEVVVEVDGWSVITSYVAAGVGIAVVPDLCLIARDGLWRISLAGMVPARHYGAMTRRDGDLPFAARRLLSIMVPDLAGAL